MTIQVAAEQALLFESIEICVKCSIQLIRFLKQLAVLIAGELGRGQEVIKVASNLVGDTKVGFELRLAL